MTNYSKSVHEALEAQYRVTHGLTDAGRPVQVKSDTLLLLGAVGIILLVIAYYMMTPKTGLESSRSRRRRRSEGYASFARDVERRMPTPQPYPGVHYEQGVPMMYAVDVAQPPPTMMAPMPNPYSQMGMYQNVMPSPYLGGHQQAGLVPVVAPNPASHRGSYVVTGMSRN